MNTHDDITALHALYHRAWAAMIVKDASELRATHAPQFTLTHMTGKRQPREDYIGKIVDGTLNYYNEHTENIDVGLHGSERAGVTGHSIVTAAVYGGGRHTWHLRMAFTAAKQDSGEWKFTECKVSTY